MAVALEVRNLWKTYLVGIRSCSARVSVLRGVDLEVAEGERVGILGGPASGKTTLLHCLAGLRRPDAGRIRLRSGLEAVVLVDEGRRIDASPSGVAGATVVVARELATLRGRVDRVVLLVDGRIAAPSSEAGRRVAEPRGVGALDVHNPACCAE